MTEEKLYELSYNAHEEAEQHMLAALVAYLRSGDVPVDALACLADPQWNWRSRSSLSGYIIDQANEVLNERLEALVS